MVSTACTIGLLLSRVENRAGISHVDIAARVHALVRLGEYSFVLPPDDLGHRRGIASCSLRHTCVMLSCPPPTLPALAT